MTRGFTLLEMVIVGGIALVVGTFLASILVNHSGVSYKQGSIVNSGLSLNDSMKTIDENIKQAAAVASSYPESSPIYTTSAEVLVLKLPAINSSGIINNVYDYVVVAKDTANTKILRLYVFPDAQSSRLSANMVLTTILQSVQFQFMDKNGNAVSPNAATSVGVNLTVLSKLGSIGQNQSASSVTSLRNAI